MRMSYCLTLEHIKCKHIIPFAPFGLAMFISMKVSIIKKLIDKTTDIPDVIEPHREFKDRIIYKKNFRFTLVVTGIIGPIVRLCL